MANGWRDWEERGKLVDAVQTVRAQVAAACRAAGRAEDSVRVVAVAKFHPASAVAAALAAGLQDIGENRVQEARAKMREVPGATWHMIGRLQSNKAALAARLFDWVHSLDRIELVSALGGGAARRRDPLQVLVQVNLAGEAQKGGCDPGETRAVLEACREYPALKPRGLMIVPPASGDPRQQFAALRELLGTLRDEFPEFALDQLSMGMSGDFEAAIAEGATMVRIGTALFGPRQGG